MGSSRLLVSFTLVVIMAISYEPSPRMGVNASDVPTTCDHYCNQTLERRHQESADKEDELVGGAFSYKIYGHPNSTNTRRVLAIVHEKDLDFIRIFVDLKAGDQKKPAFLSLNPFGQVPVLQDGNLVLTESRAISEYIATVRRTRGTQLLNYESHKTMGTQKMWMSIESSEFDPPSSILVWEQTYKPMKGLKTDYKLVKETESKLEKVLDIYEKRLEKTSYLAGEKFTLADLHHLPNIQYLMDTPTKRLFKNRPSVHRWVAKIMARPAWKKACHETDWRHCEVC